MIAANLFLNDKFSKVINSGDVLLFCVLLFYFTISLSSETLHRKAPARLPDETLQPDWGFLQTEELNVVNVISVVTPSSFFVQRIKFQNV